MKIGNKEFKMEQVLTSVVTAVIVALLTLWLPDANRTAQDAGIPIRCEVVKDAGSHADASDMPQDVTLASEVTHAQD